MNWLKNALDSVHNLIHGIKRFITLMKCTQKAIQKVQDGLFPHETVTPPEKEKIKQLCAIELPWYVVADLILAERQRKNVIAVIATRIGELTEEELEWIHNCLTTSNMSIDEMIREIQKSRSSQTPLPKLKP
ncbi:hypothetical protein [Burkholderia glumae]|uniref:Uncharacterized protein n=1 Tax=Burkholderia glumae TaxID=337 RepID=A0AAQ0BT75_BURGL|nr:hypothetical protein [Burkholderia glumae]MCM2538687.1 hypothetical protein [Burkholderia glumae]QPQ92993.1 hypothetical protein I6H06_11785 [Burkholderia glumae]QQM91805.1 hypothetical protein I6G78_05965 [Burkholderia glumae]USS44983.1 hypothetical protein NFI99_25625 [Burkholderia glumae]